MTSAPVKDPIVVVRQFSPEFSVSWMRDEFDRVESPFEYIVSEKMPALGFNGTLDEFLTQHCAGDIGTQLKSMRTHAKDAQTSVRKIFEEIGEKGSHIGGDFYVKQSDWVAFQQKAAALKSGVGELRALAETFAAARKQDGGLSNPTLAAFRRGFVDSDNVGAVIGTQRVFYTLDDISSRVSNVLSEPVYRAHYHIISSTSSNFIRESSFFGLGVGKKTVVDLNRCPGVPERVEMVHHLKKLCGEKGVKVKGNKAIISGYTPEQVVTHVEGYKSVLVDPEHGATGFLWQLEEAAKKAPHHTPQIPAKAAAADTPRAPAPAPAATSQAPAPTVEAHAPASPPKPAPAATTITEAPRTPERPPAPPATSAPAATTSVPTPEASAAAKAAPHAHEVPAPTPAAATHTPTTSSSARSYSSHSGSSAVSATEKTLEHPGGGRWGKIALITAGVGAGLYVLYKMMQKPAKKETSEQPLALMQTNSVELGNLTKINAPAAGIVR